MSKLDHDIPAPEGWPTRWVERDLQALAYYVSVISTLLGLCMIFNLVRVFRHLNTARKELFANPSDRAAIFKKMHQKARKTDRGHFKIAMAYMLNSFVITMVDGGIAFFVLFKDVSDNPEIWDKEMVLSAGLYCVYLLVLFAASFILVPLLQMLAVTWTLKRFSKKNTLSEYVPQARAWSTVIALIWSAASFCVVCGWPVVGNSDQTDVRFLVLEAVWGSAIAWLEAAFLFNYLGHAIGDKDLNRGNGVGEIVSLFAKAASASFRKSGSDSLPMYREDLEQEELIQEKQPLL